MAIEAHDFVPSSPTNTFATLNPLVLRGGTLSDGNLKLSGGGGGNLGGDNTGSFGTILIQRTGKWYVEVRTNDHDDDHALMIIPTSHYIETAQATSKGLYIISYSSTITIQTDGTTTTLGSVTETATTTGDVLGYLIDVENGRVTITKNGVHKLTVTNWTALDEEHFIGYNVNTTWPLCNKTFNFGQDATFSNLETPASSHIDQNGHGEFLYAPVDSSGNAITDFNSLCTANIQNDLAIDPAEDNLPEDFFKCLTYLGPNPSASYVENRLNFQPDLVWVKSRSAAYSHNIHDSVRGPSSYLVSDTVAAAVTSLSNICVFNSNGFTLSSQNSANAAGTSNVAWCWRAAGNNAANGNANLIDTNGTSSTPTISSIVNAADTGSGTYITPTRMSINQQAGFSITKYSGVLTSSITSAFVPHGISSTTKLDFCIIKNLTNANTWIVAHSAATGGHVLCLQSTGASATTPAVDPTYGRIGGLYTDKVLLSRGSARGDNVGEDLSSYEYIMYSWVSRKGFSKFASYTGNGSATAGPFIATGFKPALVLIKQISSTTTHTSWAIYDNAREPNNVMNNPLYANKNAAEGKRGNGTTDATDIDIDFLSNGFRILTNKEELNDNGESYIFSCWAEMPQKYAVAR